MSVKSLPYIILSVLISFISTEEILFAWEMHRHGARAPFKGVVGGVDAYKENWTQIQELSDVGKRMLYLLGAKVRKRYVDQYHLINGNYDPQEVYIRSTDVNRTLESVASFLQGLFPEGTGPILSEKIANITNITYPPNIKYQKEFDEILKKYNLNTTNAALPYQMSFEPVHLFYKPKHEFQLYDAEICKGHQEIYKKQQVRKEILDFGDELNQKIPMLKQLEGTTNDTFLRDYWVLYKYMDGFVCDDVDQRNFSYIKEKYNYDDETRDLLRKYSKQYLWMDYSDTNYPKGYDNISIVANSYTIHSIINWMEQAIKKSQEKKTYIKLVIYSAHDASIGALEAFMRYVFNTEMDYCNFAESRYFELYKDNSGEYKVRYITGNNTAKIEKPFEEFKRIMNEKTWDDDKVNKYCQFTQEDDGKKNEGSKVTFYLLFVFGGIDLVILTILIILCIKNKKE